MSKFSGLGTEHRSIRALMPFASSASHRLSFKEIKQINRAETDGIQWRQWLAQISDIHNHIAPLTCRPPQSIPTINLFHFLFSPSSSVCWEIQKKWTIKSRGVGSEFDYPCHRSQWGWDDVWSRSAYASSIYRYGRSLCVHLGYRTLYAHTPPSTQPPSG